MHVCVNACYACIAAWVHVCVCVRLPASMDVRNVMCMPVRMHVYVDGWMAALQIRLIVCHHDWLPARLPVCVCDCCMYE